MRITLQVLFICLVMVMTEPTWADPGLEGEMVVLPPEVILVNEDGAKVKFPAAIKVILGSPVLDKKKKIKYPFTVSGKTYFAPEQTLVAAGLTTQKDCDLLRESVGKSNQSDLKKVAKAASKVKISLANLPSPNDGWNKSCQNFIQADGVIGAWGQQFLSAAQGIKVGAANSLQAMMMPNLWLKVCPGFQNFSEQQKQHFIVSFIATKAMDEASCNPNATNGASKNPPGVGFFQLEGQAELRARRGQACSGGYKKGTQETLKKEVQFSCAAFQIMETQFNRGLPFCSPGGYWQEANSMRGDICQTMSQYPGCGG
jgi:hypothetical protein